MSRFRDYFSAWARASFTLRHLQRQTRSNKLSVVLTNRAWSPRSSDTNPWASVQPHCRSRRGREGSKTSLIGCSTMCRSQTKHLLARGELPTPLHWDICFCVKISKYLRCCASWIRGKLRTAEAFHREEEAGRRCYLEFACTTLTGSNNYCKQLQNITGNTRSRYVMRLHPADFTPGIAKFIF